MWEGKIRILCHLNGPYLPTKKEKKRMDLICNLCRPIIDIHYIYFFILKYTFSIIEYGMSMRKVENPFVYNWINQ